MVLRVSNQFNSGMVEIQLGALIDSDGGYNSDPDPGDNSWTLITYNQHMSGAGPDLIHALAEHFNNRIDVYGVDSTFVLSNGIPINTVCGITGFDPNNTSVITIVYDTSDCSGANYFAYDTGGNMIPFPSYVILGHELYHAFHLANGDFNAANPEQQAETGENQLRAHFGLALRDVNNHNGGCGGPAAVTVCIIASAAYESPIAPEVNMLRDLREIFLSNSILGQVFFECLNDEYYQFSPGIAKDMQGSAELKTSISQIAVEPLLNFFHLLEKYLYEGWRPEKQEKCTVSIRSDLQRYCHDLAEQGFNPCQIKAVAEKLRSYGQLAVTDNPVLIQEPYHSTIEAPEDASPDAVLDYIKNRIETSSLRADYVYWGLLCPLKTYWSMIEMLDKHEPDDMELFRYFSRAVDEWLGSVPIPSTFDQFDEATVRNDLAMLADIAFTIPSVRGRIGARIAERYSGRVTYDLPTVLQETGYYPGNERNAEV